MSRDVYLDNVMRERWDDTTRTLTTYSTAGVLTMTRRAKAT